MMVVTKFAARSKSKTQVARRKLPSIAARTLAILASLGSSSFPSSSVQQQPQSQKNQTELPNQRFSDFFHPRLPLPHHPWSHVSAFQSETTLARLPPRGRRRCQGESIHHLGHHPLRRWESNGNTHRWYHNSARKSLPILRGENDDDESVSSASTNTASTFHRATIESTRHLPRLFVSSLLSSGSTISNTDAASSTTTATVIPLRTTSLVPLSADQEHYLLDVMRITNPKRWGNRGSNSGGIDYTGCVRIFNGLDGEWLAKIVGAEEGGGNPKPSRSRSKRKRTGASAGGAVVLECLELLRPQEISNKTNNSLELCLYLGYLRDKQRRRWVFEKATELGIDALHILETDFSNGGESNASYKKKELSWETDCSKHRLHVIEAAEQSERLTVPTVGQDPWTMDALSEAVRESKNSDGNHRHLWLVCQERSESSPPLLSVLDEVTAAASAVITTIHLLVGPEGGWSPRELETLAALENVRFVSLGPSVLRAETAAITAVASVKMHQESHRG